MPSDDRFYPDLGRSRNHREPEPLDPKRIAAKLDAYRESAASSSTLLLNHLKLVESQTAAATDLQTRVGHDVVILHRGHAYVPQCEGSRTCYVIMPVFDLEAELLGSTLPVEVQDLVKGWTPPNGDATR